MVLVSARLVFGAWCLMHRNVADLEMGYVHEFATMGDHRLVDPVRSLMRKAMTSGCVTTVSIYPRSLAVDSPLFRELPRKYEIACYQPPRYSKSSSPANQY
ncbi:MAG: hypothetical protein E6R06_28900 [Mycobacterium sp.]|nr:MAG: hypothetical protein E6R06_28900 [Mycobacterium sp.]